MSGLKHIDYIYTFAAAAFIYTVTAIFSVGYEHPNEYFRIIELALIKTGATPTGDLQALFASRVQSGFQPFLAYGFLKAFTWAGLSNPFTQMTVIRALMGVFCLTVSALGIKALLPSIKEEVLHMPLLLLVPLLWFIPFISVRFSSETLSGSLFFLAFALILLRRNPHSTAFIYKVPWLVPGLLMGLSFESYYPIGIAVFAFLLWVIIMGKEKFAHIALIISGILMGIGCGVLANYWLYGEMCYPFMNNLSEIFNAHAPQDDLTPWYYWLFEILISGGFIVGIVVLLSIGWFWTRHFKNPVTWVTLSYLIFCTFMPDILICTLFPCAFFMPYIIIYTAQDFIILTEKHIGPRFSSISFSTISILFILANSIFISLFAFKAADPDTAIIQYLDKEFNTEDVLLLYAENSNPYETSDSLHIQNTFYLPGNLEKYEVSDPEDVQAYYSRRDKTILLCIRKSEADAGFFPDPAKFIKIHESLPREYFFFTGNYWERDYEALTIYQYNNCKLFY